MESDNPLLKRAYALEGDAKRIRDLYADWAASYDADTLEGMGYVAPVIAARALSEALEGDASDARILDAGCGTGLVGAELARRTQAEIDGIDLSPGMLEEAARKEVYRTLAEADMTAALDLPDNSYDGVVSVGVFTSGHVRAGGDRRACPRRPAGRSACRDGAREGLGARRLCRPSGGTGTPRAHPAARDQ